MLCYVNYVMLITCYVMLITCYVNMLIMSCYINYVNYVNYVMLC